MNLRELPEEGTSFHALGSRRALSLELSAGATVRALSGTVWLTEEGNSEDVVLGAGDYFTTTRSGLVVMNAVQESAIVRVELDEPGNQPRYVLSTELVAALEQKARRLRQAEFARLTNLLVDRVVSFTRAAARYLSLSRPSTTSQSRL